MGRSSAAKEPTYGQLLNDLSSLIKEGRKFAVRQVNTALVGTYWLMGGRIVEYEQKGKRRAEYGDELLVKLSIDLAKQFGEGFRRANLNLMRQFYLTYPVRGIIQTVSGQFENLPHRFIPSLKDMFASVTKRLSLSWSHYCLLMRLKESPKREFYENESMRGSWSVRQLDRQIQSMLYERTALSRRKQFLLAKAHEHPIIVRPEDEIKDPYVLEFLSLKDEYSESDLEDALIRHLENFLLELGLGFTFVARQKRFMVGGNHYRIDLLLYHRILKSLVIADIKLNEFTHADAGQMNFYLNWAKDHAKLSDENDPIGIILCSGKNKAYVKYALGGMENKIFVPEYRLKLPKAEELEREIERERKRFLEHQAVVEKKEPA